MTIGLIDPANEAMVAVTQLMGDERCIDVLAAEERIGCKLT